MLNCTIVGKLNFDPKFDQTKGGKEYCRFQLSKKKATKQGSDAEYTNVQVSVWGEKQVEFARKYFKKGAILAATGTPEANSYESKITGKLVQQLAIPFASVEIVAFAQDEVEDSNSDDNEPSF